MSNSRQLKPSALEPTPSPSLPAAEDYRRLMHRALQKLPHDRTVLAVGCEEAFLAVQLAEYAGDVTVLDTSAAQVTQLAPRFPEISFLLHHPAQPLPFPRGTFDSIWCCEYLDRVFDPRAMMGELLRVLRPGGEVHIAVPDHGRMRNVLIALFRWEQHFAPVNPRIRHYTGRSLRGLAREAGFIAPRLLRTGAVRRVPGRLVPRTLLLSARKPVAVSRSVPAQVLPGRPAGAATVSASW